MGLLILSDMLSHVPLGNSLMLRYLLMVAIKKTAGGIAAQRFIADSST